MNIKKLANGTLVATLPCGKMFSGLDEEGLIEHCQDWQKRQTCQTGEMEMTILTNAEVIKECRAAARASGLTFKRANATINNKQAYAFYCRRTGSIKTCAMTLSTAYENVCSGYIDSLKI